MRTSRSALLGLALAAAVLPACASLRANPKSPEVIAGSGAASSVAALDAAIARSRVVYVGESHDQRTHHALQRRALRLMHESSPAPVMVGMEMFQRPFQRHLDDYVAGLIDEREMLRRTQWYTRWSMDHTQYAGIWRYCRAHGLRVVALNADRGVIRKISREGLDALDWGERGQIAADIDLNVASHRARIEHVFTGGGAHDVDAAMLEGMYTAQTTWDETMAESAAMALEQAGPGARMVVVAGSYHVQEWNGIPDRLTRRIGAGPDLLVVARTGERREGEPPAAELGDFVVRFDPVEEPPAPKLGVMFDLTPRHDGLLVTGVSEGGSAHAAGMLAGDVLTALNVTEPATDLTDVRYFLERHAVGDSVSATVRRGPESLVLPMTLRPAPPPPPRSEMTNPHEPTEPDADDSDEADDDDEADDTDEADDDGDHGGRDEK